MAHEVDAKHRCNPEIKPDAMCGAGAPCPDCNELSGDVPSVAKVITSITAVRGKGWVN